MVSATINFSRKNYADHFPENPFPDDVKLVGNTIKSKKMPEYISKFLTVGIRLLLNGKGQEFLNEYYNYIEKIYNYKIPLLDIATKGKIKKSIAEYQKDVQEITKAGRPKSRQAWYELAIKNDLHVDNGDTIYYINTGKSKSHSDIKKVTHYYVYDDNTLFNGKREITKDIDKGYKEYKKNNTNNPMDKITWINKTYPSFFVEEEVVFNCVLVPQNIINSDVDMFCSEENGIEYNTSKYIDMFNKRITPLLVCFNKEIRNKILIENPNDRQYFTEEQCILSSGEPNKPGDQDTYEQLMTMEDKEIKFWMKYDLIPPFVEECGMGTWENIKKEYIERMENEKRLGIDKERELYATYIDKLSRDEVNKFMEEGEIPSSLLRIIDIDPLSNNFVSKNYKDVIIGSISDIIDKEFDTFVEDVE